MGILTLNRTGGMLGNIIVYIKSSYGTNSLGALGSMRVFIAASLNLAIQNNQKYNFYYFNSPSF
jgi:uncharacterized membrane protein YdcZ (DUF606 family)